MIDGRTVEVGWQLVTLKHPAPFIIAFALAGCGSFPPRYPAGMPPLAAVESTLETCAPIAGSYMDNGNGIREDGEKLQSVSLTRILHSPHPPAETADVVVMRGPEHDVIDVESFKGRTSIAILKKPIIKEIHEKYRPQGYACTKGFIPFHIESHFGALAPLPIAGYSGEELWLRKAVDESLIVLRIKDSGGLVILAPWGSREITWYRFPPASKRSENMPDPGQPAQP